MLRGSALDGYRGLILASAPYPLRTVIDVAQELAGSPDGGVRWLSKPLLVARGYYAPDHFEYDDWVEREDVEAAWKSVADGLPNRELLSMGGIGGHPGGGWLDVIRAHDLPTGGCIYTWEEDVADVGRQATLLIATSARRDDDADLRVAELALSVEADVGLGLARAACAGACDEFGTVLPMSRAVPLLVPALAEVGELYDPGMEELAEQAPENLEPWGPEWLAWLVERAFF